MQESLSFIISSYTEIAEWRSVVERLAGFEEALERVTTRARTAAGIERTSGDAARLTIEALEIDLPTGQPLITAVNLSLARGDTALLLGPSGSGKSTLLRAIAGIWPFGRSAIRMPHDFRVLFLPQKPYLPIGMLRDVVSYPIPTAEFMIRESVKRSTPWAYRISPGDSMRLVTGLSSSLPASSSALLSHVRWCSGPTGFF